MDYYIRVAREVPPPGDYAIVLKVSLGSPDTMVDASGFATNYGTFYPVVDGYRDTRQHPRQPRRDRLGLDLHLQPERHAGPHPDGPVGHGRVQRRLERQEHGRHPSGQRQVQDRLDRHRHERATTVSDTRYVTLSTKKLITKTFTQTIDGAKYSTLLKTGTGSASKTTTAYTGGLKMTSGVERHRRGGLLVLPPPSAISYTTVTFTAIGKCTTNTMMIGLQNWTVCTTYSVSCVTATHGGPALVGARRVGLGQRSRVQAVYPTSIHSVRGYIFAPALPGTIRTLDVRDVKVTVTYKVLG